MRPLARSRPILYWRNAELRSLAEAFSLQRTSSLQRQVRFRCSNCYADRRIAHPCSAPPRDLNVASLIAHIARPHCHRETPRHGRSFPVAPSGGGDQVQAILAGKLAAEGERGAKLW